ncbi:FkbM family methyltransferase [Agrobacterium sp. fls2-241-TYG-188a]|uniref:FkbM family methyltransferase n=1 Tax=Agrobacterium sp. fls2-241-TYG-188a TaxID=3040275 RepID=UPI00254E6503|nr:FkbM family methyltransferase [Agrobacterium sp. fls2-241-TYG-188a]
MRDITDTFQPNIYCALINARNWARGKKHRISPSGEQNIYRVTDGQNELFICRRKRHNRSKNGVLAGVEALAKQYSLEHIPLSPGDWFIDCGANIGELGVWAKNRDLHYIAFEPEPLEARCVNLNAFGGENRVNRLALWSEDTLLDFFSKPGTADSSAIEINDFDAVRKVQAKRLDAILTDLPANNKVVLKIEAEGAEPEVLAGSENMLSKIAYIAIDCGFERGKESAHTFTETNNFLVDRGFRVEIAKFPRMTMVYKNVQNV